jgi:hypothetical protein
MKIHTTKNRNQRLFGKLLLQGPKADKRVSTILDANSWRNTKTYTTTMRRHSESNTIILVILLRFRWNSARRLEFWHEDTRKL